MKNRQNQIANYFPGEYSQIKRRKNQAEEEKRAQDAQDQNKRSRSNKKSGNVRDSKSPLENKEFHELL